MSNFETAHAAICALIDDFAAHREKYMDPGYSEAQARLDFIDKFWTALGWDVGHVSQKNPYEQEVRVERTVIVGGAQKKADYAFFLAPNFSQTLFFVEAKKPFATLDALDHCFQLVRYAWNAGCPLSVLHDFEELLVLDCRWRPDKETAQSRIWKRFHYTEFKDEAKLRELYHLFSREAASEGAIAKRAAELRKPKGKSIQRELFKLQSQTLDEAFLSELEEWREDLAKGFKRDNEDLDSETLTEITQRTLDRLVFLRFLEDKGIEQQTTVGKLGARSGSPWTDFRAASRRLDGIYNGAIFRRHPILDSDSFSMSDDVFGGICERLDAVNSPYDFNVIPIHILGSIYERFLGSVIIATDKRAKVEQKPDVRKAGGVYYTPEYIVRYIVDQTVGRQIAGKTPDQIEKMSFADIACGSGSFLLGVFDCLLRHHTKWFNEHPDKAALPKPVKITKKGLPHKQRRELAGDCYKDPHTGSLRLTLEKKRQILLNNVFGTDLDPQAVEVAQLSLYLKLLEDETAGTTHQYSLDFDREALLPSLESNIVCGNALIGTDISGLFALPPDEEVNLRPMDFETTFPEVFERGGFDAIVGNPPWGASLDDTALEYLRSKHKEIIDRMVDTYIFFMHRACGMMQRGNPLGYVIPSTVLNQTDATAIRRYLLKRGLRAVVSLGEGIFGRQALNTTTCLVSEKSKVVEVGDFVSVSLAEKEEAIKSATQKVSWPEYKQMSETDPHFTLFVSCFAEVRLLQTVQKRSPKLSEWIIGDIERGVSPDYAPAHVIPHQLGSINIEEEICRVGISGKQIKRYMPWHPDQTIIYTTRETPIKNYPNALDHLSKFRSNNTCREVKEGKHPWWALHRPRNPAIFKSPKFIGLTTTRRIELIYDADRNLVVTDAMYVFRTNHLIDPMLVLAVLQSRFFQFLYRIANLGEGRVIPQVKASKLSTLPVPAIKPSNDIERAIRQKTIECVVQLIEAKQQETNSASETKRDFWARKAGGLERRIDSMVYQLYGLNTDQIALVKGRSEETNNEEVNTDA